MDHSAIFSPVFAMITLTIVVWTYMYSRRIPFIRHNKLDLDNMNPNELIAITPRGVRTPSDNLRNLFELPVLFYAVAIYLYVTSQVDQSYLAAAWIFVAFRIMHSAVHCTINVVLLRFLLYVVATIALWFMLIRAMLGHFGS
jgi:hypothetical protein